MTEALSCCTLNYSPKMIFMSKGRLSQTIPNDKEKAVWLRDTIGGLNSNKAARNPT